VNAELRVGAVEETITVTGEAPIVDIQTSTKSQAMGHDFIDALPTGRMYYNLGALVTGVDGSEETVRAARKRLPDAALVAADIQELPVELRRGRFDVVYSSWGTLALVSDLGRWTAGIAAALRRGGVLLAYDEHPVAACLDQMLHWHESYFDAWPVSRVVEALLGAGLGLERLEELPDPNRWGRREVRVPGDLVVIARKP